MTYPSTVLSSFFGGAAFGPGGASHIPNAIDTDTTADWVRNDFDGFGFPGFPGSPEIGEARNTPGAVNVPITTFNDPVGVCGDPSTLIHDIQGAGLASGDVGNIREIEGSRLFRALRLAPLGVLETTEASTLESLLADVDLERLLDELGRLPRIGRRLQELSAELKLWGIGAAVSASMNDADRPRPRVALSRSQLDVRLLVWVCY